MKNKKIILDIIMFILMVLLMNLIFTGIALHEIIGLIVFVLFFVHKYYNFKWIKAITKNMFLDSSKINGKTKFRYFIDVLLLIDIIMITLSGIFISQIIFVNVFTLSTIWSSLHHLFAALGFILIVLHALLHYKEMYVMFKNKISTIDSKFKKFIYYVIFIVISLLPLSVIASEKFINYLINPFVKESTNTTSNTNTNTNNTNSKTTITLEEYLSNLHCNGCSKHCPLLALKCSRGQAYLEAVKTAYNNEYALATDNIKLDNYTITLS